MRVLLIHGLLAPTATLWPLAQRLQRLGHTVSIFRYPSASQDLDAHAEALCAHITEFSAPIGVVAHSLGGLLVHRALARQPNLNIASRVFIATPHQGASLAQRSRRSPLRRLLPVTARSAAFDARPTPHPSPAGVILGQRDLVVRRAEGELSTATDTLTLKCGHNELLLRAHTARAIDRFLRTSRFDGEPAGSLKRALSER